MPSFARTEFGGYRLLERLAVGGSAEVFIARQQGPDGERVVVLKRILPQHAEDPVFQRLFEREARLMASFAHPTVVALLDHGEIEGCLFLALEYVDGADLAALLRTVRQGRTLRPSASLTAFVGAEICRALGHIHTRPGPGGQPLHIVHRDLSPHNVLVSRQGEVKLADFGIAKSAVGLDETTGVAIKGKYSYMAPEQTRPGAPIDARTDLFALGIVLHEMLTGVSPLTGESEAETLERVRAGSYETDLAQLGPEASPLGQIVERCLRHDPSERYASAAAVREDLERVARGVTQAVARGELAQWVAATEPEAPSGLDRRVRALLAGEQSEAGRTVRLVAKRRHGASEAPRTPVGSAPIASGGRSWAGPTALVLLCLAGVVAGLAWWGQRGGQAPSSGPVADVTSRAADAGARVRASGLADAARPDGSPARAAAPARDATVRRRAARFGRLTVNSVPWARVYLDGRFIGNTPVRNRRVTAGRHRVQLRDGSGRLLRTFVTRVEAGRSRVLSAYRE